jgi:YidC/Oxa1 family membrane protein insertase
MSDKNIGIWIFSILSIGIFLVWDYFFIKPLQIQEKETTNTTAISNAQESDISSSKSLNLQNTNIQTSQIKDLKDELTNHKVVNINSKNFTGRINLADGKIDYLLLKDYNLDLNSSEKIIMLNPKNTLNTSYITTGLLLEETEDSKIAWQSKFARTNRFKRSCVNKKNKSKFNCHQNN